MRLEIVLDVLPVDDALGSELPARKEEREESLGGKATVVCAPDHGWEARGVRIRGGRPFGVQNGAFCCGEVTGVDTARGYSPIRGTGATRETRPL